MACHRLPRTGALPKRNGGKAQAGGEGHQNKAAGGSGPETGPPPPGQPSLQFVQIPAHASSFFARPSVSAAALIMGSQELSGAGPLRWLANALGAPYSGLSAFSAFRLPAKRQAALSRAQNRAAGRSPGRTGPGRIRPAARRPWACRPDWGRFRIRVILGHKDSEFSKCYLKQ